MPSASTATSAITHKTVVNLSLNEGLVAQATAYTSNLSATMEELLSKYVAQQQADAASVDWNAVHAAVGSFADGHTTV